LNVEPRKAGLEVTTSREAPLLKVDAADHSAAEEWRRCVDASEQAELYHDYRWRLLIEEIFGHECHYLVVRDSSRAIRGLVPLVRLRSLLFGDFLVSVPYFNYGGILADSQAAERVLTEAVAAHGRTLGVSHVELRHRAGRSLEWPARDDKVAMTLELPAEESALLKSFGSKLRAQIKRPQKAGATCRSGGLELLDDFFAVFARNMRDLGTPVYPRRFFARILELFPKQARIIVVDLRGEPVAAGLALQHRATIEIPWASSLRKANPEGVNMLLYWAVLRYAIASGCRRFDFGRSSKDSGTYRFKQQWGAQPQQLCWHYWLAENGALPQLTPTNPKYRLAIALWKRLPLAAANWLGPQIVAKLP
jgi:FemAB-related protein (PEP-CTERM system-associated)